MKDGRFVSGIRSLALEASKDSKKVTPNNKDAIGEVPRVVGGASAGLRAFMHCPFRALFMSGRFRRHVHECPREDDFRM